MREGREYTCPSCGTTSPVGVSCSSCKVPMLDENGNPPLKPMPKSPNWVVSMWTILGAALVGIGYTVLRMIGGSDREAAQALLFQGRPDAPVLLLIG